MINLKRVVDAIVNGQEVDWKTVRHQHVALGEGGGLIAGNPKVFGNKYKDINSKGNISKNKGDRKMVVRREIKKVDLSNLKGSEKQKKWANDIINSVRNSVDNMIESRVKKINDLYEKGGDHEIYAKEEIEPEKELWEDVSEQLESTLKKIDSAVQIIENRNLFKIERFESYVNKEMFKAKNKKHEKLLER